MSFFDDYFSYCGDSEIPMVFHRWTALSIIGATLGRQVHFPFGHGKIFPNQYVLLTGSPGTRKGSAIKVGTSLLRDLDFDAFATNRAAKEALWEWMAKQESQQDVDDWIDGAIEDGPNKDFVSQAYIATDEFLDFIGMGDEGLMTNLTNLWDNLPEYTHSKTRARDITVYNPTINILSGITPGGIAEAFKSLAASGGFFSRILFIYSNPLTRKVTFPTAPDATLKDSLLEQLVEMSELSGPVILKPNGPVYQLLDAIYKNTPQMQDPRFSYYAQRRFTHLLKLVTIFAAADLTLEPTIDHVLEANTVLAVAESQMHNAIGEYGKSKHAEVSNKIVELISHSDTPVSPKIVWKNVARDLDKMSTLTEIMANLVSSDRIAKVEIKGEFYYIDNMKHKTVWQPDFLDYSKLHIHEHHIDTGDNSDENLRLSL